MNATLPFSKYSRILTKTMRFPFFVFVFLISPAIQAQELSKASLKEEFNALYEKPFKIISFGEKINFGELENSIFWTISNMDSNKKSSLIGNEINSYIFENPGEYKITFHENKGIIDGECNHAVFPELMIIRVSAFKMDFDFSTIQFNKKLVAGENIENSELTLNVSFKSFKNDSLVFSKGKIISAGIGTTISGQLLNEVTLKPGNNKVTYKLSGSASKDTYIMLDFFDINEQVQSYYYPTKL